MKTSYYGYGRPIIFENEPIFSFPHKYDWVDYEIEFKDVRDVRSYNSRKIIPSGNMCYRFANNEKVKCRYYNDIGVKVSCELLNVTEIDAPQLRNGIKLCDNEVYDVVKKYQGFVL